SSTAAEPTFTAPLAGATLTFSLVVRDDRGMGSTASSVTVTVNPPPAGTVSGQVRFTRIPVMAVNGLNFGNQVLRPAGGVEVRAVAANNPNNVLATTTTDGTGSFSMSVAGNTTISLIVVARMQRATGQPLPHWNFYAQDAEAATPTPYTYTDNSTFNSDAG